MTIFLFFLQIPTGLPAVALYIKFDAYYARF